MRIIKNKKDGTTSAIFVGLVIAAIILLATFLPSIALYVVLHAIGIDFGFWACVCTMFLFYFILLSLREIFG
ncbi:hypothetical protein [Staphylococcus phage PT94]